MEYSSPRVLSKVLISCNSAASARYLWSFCKTLRASWLERSLSRRESQKMVPNLWVQCRMPMYRKLRPCLEPAMVLVTMACVEGPTIQGSSTCFLQPRSQSWEAHKPVRCSAWSSTRTRVTLRKFRSLRTLLSRIMMPREAPTSQRLASGTMALSCPRIWGECSALVLLFLSMHPSMTLKQVSLECESTASTQVLN